MTNVQLPDGQVAQFPDGMSEADIQAAIQKFIQNNPPAGTDISVITRPTPQVDLSPVLPDDATPPQTLGDVVPRELFTMGGALAGATVAGAGGVLTGPGAPAAVPAGVAAGGVGGAMIGSMTFDTLSEALRAAGVTPQADNTPAGALQTAVFEGGLEGATAGAGSALAAGGRAAIQFGRQVLGATDEIALGLARKSQNLGIPVGLIQVTQNGLPRNFARVAGIFPFVGTPIRENAAATATALESSLNNILDGVAPSTSFSALGVNAVEAAQNMTLATRARITNLYNAFIDESMGLSNPNIFDTTALKEEAQRIIDVALANRPRTVDGQVIGRPVTNDPVLAYAQDLVNIAERIDGATWRQINFDLLDLQKAAGTQGFDVGRIFGLKRARDGMIETLDTAGLDPIEAQRVVASAQEANLFFFQAMQRFQNPVSDQFLKFDRNFFDIGTFEPGSRNADEIVTAIFNPATRSPQAVQQLRDVVGDDVFGQLVRNHIDEVADAAFRRQSTGAGTEIVFDPFAFERSLGLSGRDRGQVEALNTMLEAAGGSVDDLMDFIDVAKRVGEFTLPSSSQFVARRAALGGVQSVLSIAGVGAAAATVDPITTAAGIMLARKFSSVIASPERLRLMTVALDNAAGAAQRNTAILRLIEDLGAEPAGVSPRTPQALREEE